eukprot:GEZU01000914.1.p1 GENE.GEZU01000914.1~~GEZU01000914.1.p1  ORF type:complete len:706 (-),score=347.91 GEZU01000914.1:751-2868(-)
MNWHKDAYTQSELVLHALKLATEIMAPGANFVTKVFRSQDYNALMWVFNQFFFRVEATKPQASRNASAEIFVYCQGYKAPKVIDPKLLNPKTVFEAVEVAPAKLPTYKDLKNKRNREGYEEGNLILHKTCSVKEFIETEKPISILVNYNKLSFDQAEGEPDYFNHPETTNEIKILCDDLKVLGKLDFKLLLKWRNKMRAFRDETVVDQEFKDMEEDDSDYEDIALEDDKKGKKKREQPQIDEDADEAALVAELEELKRQAEIRKKNLYKKNLAKQKKLQPRGDQLTERPTDILDTFDDANLFALDTINSKELLTKVADDVDPDELADDDSDVYISGEDKEDEDEDYDTKLEKQFDEMYKQYLEKASKRDKKALMARRKEVEAEKEDLYAVLAKEKQSSLLIGKNIEDDDDDVNSNPLLVKFDANAKNNNMSAKSKMWFSQSIFNVLRDDTEQQVSEKKKRSRDQVDSDDSDDSDDDESDDDETDSDDDSDEDYSNMKPQSNSNYNSHNKNIGGFEEVPQTLLDPNSRAETLALATKMLRKKDRLDIIDNAYNRYTFGDDEALPEWFKDDERKHNKPTKPITKAEVEEIKRKFKEINERPIKKVLEAKARKQKRQQARMNRVKEKATAIAESTQLTAEEKAKQLEALYKKAKGKKQKVKLVKGKKFGRGVSSAGGKVKQVDPRMKKDLRAEKRKKEREGGSKRRRT